MATKRIKDPAAASRGSTVSVQPLLRSARAQLKAGAHHEARETIQAVFAIEPGNPLARTLRKEILDAALRHLVAEGFAEWSGGKPKGSKHPLKPKAGPTVSDYIVEERDRLR